jgi:integrase
MNAQLPPEATAPVTLQTILDRLAENDDLAGSRQRDLCSAVTSYARVRDLPPAAIGLDLAEIRHTLDDMLPSRAKVSPKRWANLRSDLAAAIAASGLRPMLKTADLHLDEGWARLLAGAGHRARNGLSRFARWASLRRIRPAEVDNTAMDRFVVELSEATLVRNLRDLPRKLARTWNAAVDLQQGSGLRRVAVPAKRRVLNHVPWQSLPPSLRQDIDAHISWAAVPDPLANGTRKRALAPRSLRLRKMQIVAAVTAAVAAGIPLDQITSLASLVEAETFRALLRQRWQQDGRRITSYTHNGAATLIAIASEWVRASPDQIAVLKTLRSKLGLPPTGLTGKNRAMLRRFDDPRLITALVQLPDRLWRAAQRGLAKSRRQFIDLQTALAIDLLLHVPLRLQNLSAAKFDTHLHWPQGRRKPALLTIGNDETKNDVVLEFEVPTVLADRFWAYRNEIAPALIGERPQAVFVSLTGRPRKPDTIEITITKTIQRFLGVRLTPHQFRHLAAKIALDNNPGAYELVRQLLGHKNLRTTTNFYAGVDTRRAGRAHAELVMKLRETNLGRARRRRTPQPQEKDHHAQK